MTVKQLIQELEKMPKNAEVVGVGDGYNEIVYEGELLEIRTGSVSLTIATGKWSLGDRLTVDKKGWLKLAEEGDYVFANCLEDKVSKGDLVRVMLVADKEIPDEFFGERTHE